MERFFHFSLTRFSRHSRPRVAATVVTICSGLSVFFLSHSMAKAQDAPCAAKLLAEQTDKPKEYSIQSQLNWVLAKQWTNQDQVKDLLDVMSLLTSSPNPLSPGAENPNQQALKKLENIDGADLQLFRAAMGDPDSNGHPAAAPPVKLLDVLSKASFLPAPGDDTKVLFDYDLSACSTSLVDSLSKAENGKAMPLIVLIDDAFQKGGDTNYAALYQLLFAYWQYFPDGADALKNLEILRAEFAESASGLAKIVHAKVSAAQK